MKGLVITVRELAFVLGPKRIVVAMLEQRYEGTKLFLKVDSMDKSKECIA